MLSLKMRFVLCECVMLALFFYKFYAFSVLNAAASHTFVHTLLTIRASSICLFRLIVIVFQLPLTGCTAQCTMRMLYVTLWPMDFHFGWTHFRRIVSFTSDISVDRMQQFQRLKIPPPKSFSIAREKSNRKMRCFNCVRLLFIIGQSFCLRAFSRAFWLFRLLWICFDNISFLFHIICSFRTNRTMCTSLYLGTLHQFTVDHSMVMARENQTFIC